MAQTPTRTAAQPDNLETWDAKPAKRTARKRLGPRLWYLPLLLAVVLPLVLWLAANGAFAWYAVRDLGPAARARPLAGADQPILAAATALVQATACPPGSGTIGRQAPYAGAEWSARRSAANPRTYYVAASDPVTARLLGVWQVEGGQIVRLQDDRCTGLPAGSAANLAEAAILLSPSESGSNERGN